MKFFLSFVIICILSGLFAAETAGQESNRKKRESEDEEKKGKLEQFQGEEDEDQDDDSCSRNFWAELLLDIGWHAAKMLLTASPVDSTRFFVCPYADGEAGMASMAPVPGSRTGFGQLQLTLHYIDQDLYGISAHTTARLNNIAGLSFDVTHYRENRIRHPDDRMTMIRLGLMKSLMIREQMIWDLDIGIRTLDRSGGFDAGMRFRIFPRQPYTIEFWGSAGSMTHRRLFLEFRPVLGLSAGRFEWDLGFRFLRLGDEDLKGILTGIRIWI